MNKLVFKAAEVTRVVEHAVKTEGQILLVHDHGIYLMSNGEPRDMFNETSNYVVYAQGCNPELDPDWYETARELVGGDDFGEALPFASAIKEQIDNGAEEIIFSVTPENTHLEKPKVTNLRKCAQCGKLLKKKETDEVCTKCKEQTPSLEAPSENKGEENSNENGQPENKPEETSQDKSEEKSEPQPQSQPSSPIKPGQAIRDKFLELVAEGKITDEVLKVLTDKEATLKATSVRYAFLKEFNPHVEIKQLTYINGAPRYTSKPIVEINGKQYLITNDFYKQTVPKFMTWVESLK